MVITLKRAQKMLCYHFNDMVCTAWNVTVDNLCSSCLLIYPKTCIPFSYIRVLYLFKKSLEPWSYKHIVLNWEHVPPGLCLVSQFVASYLLKKPFDIISTSILIFHLYLFMFLTSVRHKKLMHGCQRFSYIMHSYFYQSYQWMLTTHANYAEQIKTNCCLYAK